MPVRKPIFFNYDEGIDQEIDPIADSVAFGSIVLNGIGGIGIDAQMQRIVNLPSPTQASDPATKGYTDIIAQGLQSKKSALASSATNIANLAGTMTLDGIAVNVGDRVLLMAQTDAKQNGLWVVQSGNWTRPPDFAAGIHAASTFCFVTEGTAFGDNGYTCITDPPNDVVDANPINFTQFNGAGQIIPGSGITKSGNTISVLLAGNSGLQFTSGALDTYLQPAGGLFKDVNGLRTLIKSAGSAAATLASDANGLSVLGVPTLFTVAGLATTANVSAPNLNTLTAGATTQADALHTHLSVIGALATQAVHTTATAVTAGDPVAWGSAGNQLARGDAGVDAQARIIGVALTSAAAASQTTVVKRGIAKNVLTGATPGAPVYLNLGGGLTMTPPSGQALRVVRLGWAVNATDLDVVIHDLGKRSA